MIIDRIQNAIAEWNDYHVTGDHLSLAAEMAVLLFASLPVDEQAEMVRKIRYQSETAVELSDQILMEFRAHDSSGTNQEHP